VGGLEEEKENRKDNPRQHSDKAHLAGAVACRFTMETSLSELGEGCQSSAINHSNNTPPLKQKKLKANGLNLIAVSLGQDGSNHNALTME